MATGKVTFTLDQETVNRIENAAGILKKPKSQIVREAVLQFHERIGKVSETERLRRLHVLDEILARPVTRSQEEVDRELRENRRARRVWGDRRNRA